MNILVIEDDRRLADLIARRLRTAGHVAETCDDGSAGLERASTNELDLAIVDVMLPGMDGVSLTRMLRTRGITTPILMLTARDGIDDRVDGLRSGADDYLVKPFALPELLARIRALLRRGRPSEVLRLKTADLELDLVTRRAIRGERLLELTAREFELLEYLLRHQGHLVSREMLAREVWKEPRRATPLDNVIDVQITRLRKKVDGDGSPRLIHTVRGVGFVLREAEP